MQDESAPQKARAELDLSLFRLPVLPEHDTVEIGISASHPSHIRKRSFWAWMARRVDLTGKNSPMKIKPYGTGHDQPLPNEIRNELLYEQLTERENANVLLDASRTRPLNLFRRVTSMIEEVQPQFFLRNIVRLERDIDVRRLSIQFAVWREDPTDDFEHIRHFELEPVEMVEEFSSEAMTELRIERQKGTLGLVWEEALAEPIRPPVKVHPFFWYPKRVSVDDLSLRPAPPYRFTPGGQTSQVLKQLWKRTDASRDEE